MKVYKYCPKCRASIEVRGYGKYLTPNIRGRKFQCKRCGALIIVKDTVLNSD